MTPCSKEKDIETILDKLETVQIAVLGDSNGNKGLVRKTDELTFKVNVMEETHKEKKNQSQAVNLLVLANILTLLGNIGIQLLLWLMKT